MSASKLHAFTKVIERYQKLLRQQGHMAVRILWQWMCQIYGISMTVQKCNLLCAILCVPDLQYGQIDTSLQQQECTMTSLLQPQ